MTAWPAPVRRDTRSRAVLIIAVLLSLGYGIEALIDLARPRLEGQSHPLVGILRSTYPLGPRATFWTYLVSLGVALLLTVVGLAQVQSVQSLYDPARRARRVRAFQLSAAAVLLAPFAMYPLSLLGGQLHYAMVCVPSTAFALWLIHRLQRYRHIPVRMLFGAFGWGALIATGFGGGMNIWLGDYYTNYVHPSENILKAAHDMTSWIVLSAGIFEELGKGAGVAILYILYRRYFDNVVSGIVVGAAVGLGFNFVESIEYMSSSGGLGSGQQYWFRQSLGLMASHVAFTAVIGAAFGIARQLPEARRGRLAITCGFVLAAAGHFANDVLIRFFGQVKENWFSPSSPVDLYVLHPAVFTVLQGPFVLLYVLLWRAGLKQQRSALEFELPAEARSGIGAITGAEVDVLLRPERRFYLKIKALQRDGMPGYIALNRLFTAQLDLGVHRWHRSRGDVDPYAPDETALRQRVARQRAHWERLATGQAEGVSV